jgi:hypothetical protein
MNVVQFSIDSLPKTFRKSGRGSITGEISVRLGNEAFPDARWNDFVVVIMGWWLEEIHKLTTGVASISYCRFMDGPYWFSVGSGRGGNLLVRCMDDKNGVKCVSEGLCTRESVLSSVLFAADLTIRKCQDESWLSSVLESLIRSYDALRKCAVESM